MIVGVDVKLRGDIMVESSNIGEKCVENGVSEIREILGWLLREANVDRALSSEVSPIEQRKLAINKVEMLIDAVRKVCREAEMAGIPPEPLRELENEVLRSVTGYYDVLSSGELSAARAFHVSQKELSRMADSIEKLLRFLSSKEMNGKEKTTEGSEAPLIKKVLELKERTRKLEEENRRLKSELERLRGSSIFLEPLEGEQKGLDKEVEELRKENMELRRQIDELRRGAEVTAYQSLLEENNTLRQRTERLLEALRATRRRYEERLQELMKERDEWRSKALERTIKTIEDTMFELRSQIESLKKENKELKEKLGIEPIEKKGEVKEGDYEFYFS